MKRFFIFIILFLSFSEIVNAQEETLSQIFTNRVDLTKSNMSEIKKLVDAGKLQEALDLWRDTVVNRFRRIDFDQFGWHSYKTHPRQTSWASYLLGYMTESAYLAQSTGVDYYDYFNLAGKPGASPTPNWTNKPGIGETNNGAGTYLMFIPLASKYYLDYKTEYKDKWFEVTNDFANKSRAAISALDDATKKTMNPGYSTGAQDVLDQGARLKNIIRCIAVFAKNLPGETKISSWDNVISEKRNPVSRSMAQNIPSKSLMNIVIHLFRDNPDILLSVYRYAGKVPNQRFNGLMGMYMTQVLFPEIKDPSNYRSETKAGLQDYVKTMFYKDGAMIEQSFNYNSGDAGEIEAAINLLSSANVTDPLITVDFANALKNYRRMIVGIKNPLLVDPIVGNLAHSNQTEIWKDNTTLNTWVSGKTGGLGTDLLSVQVKNSFTNATGTKPLFTSASMPYGGYHALRNGWNVTSSYLFMNTARPARGHSTADYNGIQIVAYGRELLTLGGQPDYNGKLEGGIAGFLSEGSSFKCNTIVVDDKSQYRQPILQTCATSTINNKTYFSNSFDFIDGTFSMGYGGTTAADIKDVSHHREISYIKDADLWIVTDEMLNTGTSTRTYTQTWNFTPYNTANNAYGFTQSEVTSDNTKRMIYTTDANGPNISMKHIGKASMTYTKYYGNKNPYYGWYAPGISSAIETVNMHSSFSGNGNQIVGTVIIPSPDQVFEPVVTDLSSDNSTISIKIVLPNGDEMYFQKSLTAKKVTCYDFTFTAKGYLLKKSTNGDISGYINGTTDKSIDWKGNQIGHTFTDFAVELTASSSTVKLISFFTPDTFMWTNTPVPVYQKNVATPINWAPSPQPTLTDIPGTIEAEDFNTGGEGVGYHDFDTKNSGNVYRTTEGVDIQATTDIGGGYNVGWTLTGEWLKYDFNATKTADYTVCIRAAELSASGKLHFEIDGQNISGSVNIPVTGNWQTYTDVCVSIPIDQGEHTMKVVIDSGGFNINKYVFTEEVVTGLEEGNETSFSIWPNPATSSLTLEGLKSKVDLTITNTLGQQVFHQHISTLINQHILDVSNLQPGIYFIILDGQIKKFIKQ